MTGPNFHPQREKAQVETWRNFLRVDSRVKSQQTDLETLQAQVAALQIQLDTALSDLADSNIDVVEEDTLVSINVADIDWSAVTPPAIVSVVKTIDGVTFDAKVDFTPGSSPYPGYEPYEEFELTIYDPTGSYPVRTKTVTALGTGSPWVRDKWFDYPAAQQTSDGYTPSGTETFWIDVKQIGKYGNSPSILQEL